MLSLRKISRVLFWFVLVLTLVLDWMPHQAETWRHDNDPNILTFSVLTVLMRFAYEQLPKYIVVLVLGLLGAIIELIQLVPMLHRYSDFLDICVDLGAILIGLLLAALVHFVEDAVKRLNKKK